ncbi:MAG: serine/threonine protein phosphatase [Oscillospiraceae bacterium]
MGIFRKKEPGRAAQAAQLRSGSALPFETLCSRAAHSGELRLYRALRSTVPVVDAAIYKIIRLAGGVDVSCADPAAERELRSFLRTVDVGRGRRGVNAFLDEYMDSLLICGQAIGEIVPQWDGRDIRALLCGRPEDISVQEGKTPLDFSVWGWDEKGRSVELPYQELLLFTPFHPEGENPYGVSLLRSLPAFGELLLKIYETMGRNWERCGNARYAVICKGGEELGEGLARERCGEIAREWQSAMQETKNGSVRDFVAVGDVEIRVIGADNQILDSEVPVRQIMEQLVAKTGLPPFLLGMSWSTTERMSSQQADMLTSELTAIRRMLSPVVERICSLWLRMHGYGCGFEVVWDEINLQDQVEEAKAELYRQQARKLQKEIGEE